MGDEALSRRLFLAGGISLGAGAHPLASRDNVRYAFATEAFKIQLEVKFYDSYSSRGFWFRQGGGRRHFCLSGKAGVSGDCLVNFVGSLAIAHYRFTPRSPARPPALFREHVWTIDRDQGLDHRPPFERAIELQNGEASDIQAFGYETTPLTPSQGAQAPEAGGPWYYFRQDLYLEKQPAPFLVVHWRHGFGGIRLLDLIPGGDTWPLKESKDS